MTRRLLTTTGLLISMFVGAQTVYQSKDAQGNPVFTDQPKAGAQKIDVKPTNTTPAVVPSGAATSGESEFKGYSRIGVGVTNPVPNGLAPTDVGIVIEPALQPGHSWELRLDDQVIASGTEASVTIPRLERGTHTFTLDVIGSGGVIGSSGPVETFVFWPGGSGSSGGGRPPRVTPH